MKQISNMKSKILFANIGWMTHYKGNTKKDQIVGGGSWSNDDKHEAFNFSPIKREMLWLCSAC